MIDGKVKDQNNSISCKNEQNQADGILTIRVSIYIIEKNQVFPPNIYMMLF